MSKCKHCYKKMGITGITCKYCNLYLCSKCVQLEIHQCRNIQDNIKKSIDALNDSFKKDIDPNKTSIEYDRGNAY